LLPLIYWIGIYPVDNIIQPLNNPALTLKARRPVFVGPWITNVGQKEKDNLIVTEQQFL